MSVLTLAALQQAVDSGVAFRANTRLQPAAGPGTKVFPSTYAEDNKFNTKYATEKRRIDGEDVDCVLLDSVASQANRFEEALLDAWDAEEVSLPVLSVDFTEADQQLEAAISQVTTLDAPHRIYDAILRDSVDETGTLFRYTAIGQAITQATTRNATALYTWCPTALVFGAWDSTGPKGGLGSKFQRCLSSEIVAIGAQTGTKVGGRLDPLGIMKKAGPVFEVDGHEEWTADRPSSKSTEKRPSEINHGNIAPTRDMNAGGITFDYAQQTTVLSLPALRRLKFRYSEDGAKLSDRRAAELAARTTLAAIALAAVVGAHEEGYDLRSGALLVGNGPLTIELVDRLGAVSGSFELTCEQANALVNEAAAAAGQAGLPWPAQLPTLKPAAKLVKLLQASQALSAAEGVDSEDA